MRKTSKIKLDTDKSDMITILELESSGEFTSFNSSPIDTNINYRYEVSLAFEAENNSGYSLNVTEFSVWINERPLDQLSGIEISESASFIPFNQVLGNGYELLSLTTKFKWDAPEGGLQFIELDLYTASPSQVFDVGTTSESIVHSGLLGDFTISRDVSIGEPIADYLGLSVLNPIPEASSAALIAIGSIFALTRRLRM